MSLKVMVDVNEQKKSFSRWLVLELAPTINGNKPATILALKDTKYMALYSLWKRCGEKILARSILKHTVLKETPNSLIILFYHPESLEKCMVESTHRNFLEQRGYQVTKGLEHCLELLRTRFQHTCPHEIGLLLGIPLKDVLGFMGLNHLALTCRGLWCIYGEPSCSRALMECFKDDRKRILEMLRKGYTPLNLLSRPA